jgi:hypothetical protein
MKQTCSLTFLLLLFLGMTMASRSQTSGSTVNVATCQETDVSAVINGPTHTAVNGDVIVIPAGTCTWTTQLSISAGITLTGSGTPKTGPSTFGAGTPSTVIVDNVGNTSPLISVTGITFGQTFTVSLLDIEPNSASTTLGSPISVAGTCTSSGCPNLRVDNIIFGQTTRWTESGNGAQAQTMIRTDNVFGVIDHNTLPTGSSCSLVNINLTAYLGVGAYGDNSYAQADTFGGANELYLENNNLFTNQWITDGEFAPNGGGTGGGRYAARFNEVTCDGCLLVFGVHGLDTGNRARSMRQLEAYGNSVNCAAGTGCNALLTHRGGTGFAFGNTMSVGSSAFWNQVDAINVYRTVYSNTPWSGCGGLNSINPWDTNDNTVYYSGTATSVGGNNSSGFTLTDTTKSWSAGQFVPNGAPYSIYDVTRGTGFIAEIASNTTNTITTQVPISESAGYSSGFTSGDSYEIIRSTVCVDQAGRGAGIYVSGSTPSPSSAMSQALDPIYEWNDTVATLFHGNIGTDTGRTIANRDWYTDASNGSPQAQTSPTSPFNGSGSGGIGVGFGTLANRPTSCITGVGYFATDQGTWNTSANGFGQGVLYKCGAGNTWSTLYTPYTYPHPLTIGGTVATPAPPLNVTGTVGPS